jgi:hypothetical protein
MDCDEPLAIIDLVTDTPVAHANPPKVLSIFYFETSVRARISSESVDRFGYARRRLPV